MRWILSIILAAVCLFSLVKSDHPSCNYDCYTYCLEDMINDADYVARVRVKERMTTSLDDEYLAYTYRVVVKKTFGNNIPSIGLNETYLLVDKYCPPALIEKGAALLIAGHLVYYLDYDGIPFMWLRDCDVVTPWKGLSEEKKKMVKKGKPLTPCDPNPCQNGGSCYLSSYYFECYYCYCPTGFSGYDCEVCGTS